MSYYKDSLICLLFHTDFSNLVNEVLSSVHDILPALAYPVIHFELPKFNASFLSQIFEGSQGLSFERATTFFSQSGVVNKVTRFFGVMTLMFMQLHYSIYIVPRLSSPAQVTAGN